MTSVTMPTMARPWEHDRWRRLLMQAVMAGILGSTLGLAQLVTYTRNHTPISLGSPRQLGSLLVRLPEDWVPLPGEAAEPDLLQAQDEEGTRDLVVSIQPPSSTLVPRTSRHSPVSLSEPSPIVFKGLGLVGVQQTFPHLEPTPEGKIAEVQYLIASAELPDGDWIEIRFRESGSRIGSTDRMLVQAVANGITPGGGKMPATKRSVPIDPSNFD